ncbi:MAG TPA: acyl-CoA dehydrogenase family protein [Burkholderiaceae bacterium]|nr:acyl-CoA dehydrogenase family protein [Burkholderiaceae bacterium]
MWQYVAPLRDMKFVIEDVLDAPSSWADCPAFTDFDADTALQVLEEAARFASEVLLPTNAPGDAAGCRLEGDEVRTPKGFAAVYRSFIAGGWPALACDPEWGGQGLPQLVNAALYEMLPACNHAWSMYPGLLHGAYETLKAHGSDALRQRYLRKVVSGEWLAAMALTEPQAGSDLGTVRTRAELQPDGSLRVRGSKIFISGGDHDLTDNIVHLVLCRLPDAPPGTKGLSLALVPKRLPDGSRNAVHCDGLEHKLGIHGSATCAIRYDGASGWLLGEPNRGLAAMFLMMNAARLHVGLQGLGHIEISTQNAQRYAAERHQFKAPIERHPAMRRTLLKLQALTEGMRVIGYWTAMLLDEAEQHPDDSRRQRAHGLAALLTPVVKGFFTRNGFEGASAALQVWGGYGYVSEYGIEQALRDSRISMIYEGTNEIQAIDLVQRKLTADGAFEALMSELDDETERCRAGAALNVFAEALLAESRRARETVAALRACGDAQRILPVADDVLNAFGYLLLTWAWTSSARAAAPMTDREFAARKLEVVRFGIDWLVADSRPYWQRALNALQAHAPAAEG